MKNKWAHYSLEHLHYFNEKTMSIIAKQTGFELIDVYPAPKMMTINYLTSQFNASTNPQPLIKFIFNTLNKISLINKIKFNTFLGDSIYILKKIN